jgi:hypothetical protein
MLYVIVGLRFGDFTLDMDLMVEQTAGKAPICYGCATVTLDDHFI